MAKLVIEEVKHSFKKRRILDSGYSEFMDNEITGVIGRNGEGKSTLFNIIYGRLKADYSKVFYNGKIILKPHMSRKYISYLTQEFMLPNFTTLKNLIKMAVMKSSNKEILFKRFKDKLNRTLIRLSGGERKLFELYYIILLERPITILDEPFKGLEPKRTVEIQELIKSTKRGFIISSHLHYELFEIANRTLLLKDGRLCNYKD